MMSATMPPATPAAHRVSMLRPGRAWSTTSAPSRARADRYGVRAVIHPHAGGYIEFEDELDRIAADVPADLAGLCLDTGHLDYSGMDPVETIRRYADRTDYIHFKDIDAAKYIDVMGRHIRFFEACGEGVMCPIGRGRIDYRPCSDCLPKSTTAVTSPSNRSVIRAIPAASSRTSPRAGPSCARPVSETRNWQMKKLDLITIGRSSVDLYGDQIGGRLEAMGSFSKYIGGRQRISPAARRGLG